MRCDCCDTGLLEVRISHSPGGAASHSDDEVTNLGTTERHSGGGMCACVCGGGVFGHAGYVWYEVEAEVGDSLSLLHCILHHSG